VRCQCPLSGVKRIYRLCCEMSAKRPKADIGGQHRLLAPMPAGAPGAEELPEPVICALDFMAWHGDKVLVGSVRLLRYSRLSHAR